MAFNIPFSKEVTLHGDSELRYDDGEVVSRIFIPKCGSPSLVVVIVISEPKTMI